MEGTPAAGGLHAGPGATGGSLPVNLPVLDENYRIADAVLYEMGARGIERIGKIVWDSPF